MVASLIDNSTDSFWESDDANKDTPIYLRFEFPEPTYIEVCCVVLFLLCCIVLCCFVLYLVVLFCCVVFVTVVVLY